MPWVMAERGRYWEIAAALLCGLVAAAAGPFFAGSPGAQFAAAVCSLTLAVVVAVGLEWRRTGDRLSVLTLLGTFYLLAFGAGSVYVWFNPSFGVAVPVHQAFGHPAETRAEWLCVFAWIGLAIGYRLRLLQVLHIRPLKLNAASERAQNVTLICLYGIGWIARIAGISRGLYFHGVQTTAVASGSTTTQAIGILGILPSISVAYLGIRANSRPALRRYYGAALAVELAFAIPSGQRVDSVRILVLALAVSYYTKRRFPLKAMAIAVIFSLFFVFPVLALYRTSHSNTGYQVSDLSTGVATYTSGGVGNAMLSGIGTTLKRFSDIELPSALEERGRHAYPLPEGQTLAFIVTNYIPHAIYPNKPNPTVVANDLAYTLRVTPAHNSSFAPTQVGELYLNFGTFGLFAAMVVFGSVYREVNDWLSLRRSVPLVLALYAALAYSIIGTQEPLAANGLGALIRNLVVIAIILTATTWLLESRRSAR